MKNRDCPVCDPWLGKLAEEVPFSHHVNSTIVCRLSGKIMDEDNAPMAFPNGYVYSREVRTDFPSGYLAPFTALVLVVILTDHFCQPSGFGRDVGTKRGKSQVSSHSGRVRLLKIEEGIHILILAGLLHDSVTHVIANLSTCHGRGDRRDRTAPKFLCGRDLQRGRCVRSEPVVINAACIQ